MDPPDSTMQQAQMQSLIDAITKRVDERMGVAFQAIDQRLQDHANIAMRNQEENRRSIDGIRRNMITLWKHVRGPGSDPPPDDSNEWPALPPKGLEAKTSQHDLELDSLEGRMIEGFARVESRLKSQDDDNAKLHAKTDAQTEILNDVKTVTKHPLVKQIATALATVVLLWLTAYAAKLTNPEPPKLPTPAVHS